jgi:hypothetical protein
MQLNGIRVLVKFERFENPKDKTSTLLAETITPIGQFVPEGAILEISFMRTKKWFPTRTPLFTSES